MDTNNSQHPHSDNTTHPKILFDLILSGIWMIIAILTIFVPILNESFLRIIFVLPFILFIPGYIALAVIYPKKNSLEPVERFQLSILMSIIILSLTGFGLNYTSWGIRLVPIVMSIFVLTSIAFSIAFIQRIRLPSHNQYIIPFRDVIDNTRSLIPSSNPHKFNKILRIIIILCIIVTIITAVTTSFNPQNINTYTEFYMLNSGGWATEYPTEFPLGEKQMVIIVIENHEHRDITYIVETMLSSYKLDETTNSIIMSKSTVIDYVKVHVPHNLERKVDVNFTINDPTYNRIDFLLYSGSIPPVDTRGMDRISASYQDLHLLLNVLEPL